MESSTRWSLRKWIPENPNQRQTKIKPKLHVLKCILLSTPSPNQLHCWQHNGLSGEPKSRPFPTGSFLGHDLFCNPNSHSPELISIYPLFYLFSITQLWIKWLKGAREDGSTLSKSAKKKKFAVLINAVINTNSGLKLSYPAGFPN